MHKAVPPDETSQIRIRRLRCRTKDPLKYYHVLRARPPPLHVQAISLASRKSIRIRQLLKGTPENALFAYKNPPLATPIGSSVVSGITSGKAQPSFAGSSFGAVLQAHGRYRSASTMLDATEQPRSVSHEDADTKGRARQAVRTNGTVSQF